MQNQNGRERLEISTGSELAELLEQANRENKKVMPVGGATRMAYGNPARQLDWIISTRGLSRILAYEPNDLTLSVEAGVTLGEIQKLLADHGQAMPIETWSEDRATIGGIVSAALYGPRRFGSGTLRDYLIGVSAAYPNGTHAKAGGMVVKNVSGFDMMRMFHGSLGTLGVITSLNFKVLPAARSEATLIATFETLQHSAKAVERLLALPMRPISLVVMKEEPGWQLAARFEGREQTVSKVMNKAISSVETDVTAVPDEESRHYWREHQNLFTGSGFESYVWLRLRSLPSSVFADVASLIQEASMAATLSGLCFSPGIGTIDFKFDVESIPQAKLVDQIAQFRSQFPGLTVMTAPELVLEQIESWGGGMPSQDFMRRLKLEFDPNQILSPGRLLSDER